MKRSAFAVLAVFACLPLAVEAGAAANPARSALLAGYAAEARRADPGFHGFSADAGRAFFLARPGGGNAATPSCTTCHTSSPVNAGRTRAGKELAPMAVSRTPERFTDAAKVEKWFLRNCHTVYGRDCTAAEKGNFISYMGGL